MTIYKRAFIKELKETVRYFFMRFLEFIQQQNGKRLARDPLCNHTAPQR